ncbi:MAG TPA: c-type cytochrome [Vicinamibacteria bacterium]|jgi:mono/diheme cytochrome c family protein|nr:c-type cytochrome [Vicinamibacteria bacterium]
MARSGPTIFALVALLVLAISGVVLWRGWNIGSVERGRRLAREMGCFTCHGADGGRGVLDPGHGLGDVPTWTGGLLTMYVESPGEIREWILDGMPQRVRRDPEQMKERQGAVILMPAFRRFLSDRQADDLVAYVKAVADYETPQDQNAEEGRKVAVTFGCFNCHGPQGRGEVENPRSFKGYIPSWSGKDFPDLASDDGEIRDWILKGGTPRLESNPLARFFMGRQAVKMPAYGTNLKAQDLDRLLDYIHWLRRHPV